MSIPALTNEEYQEIVARLATLGYTAVTTDETAIKMSGALTKNHILNEIAADSIPDGLHLMFVDMASGEFLKTKFSTGSTLPDINVDDALQSVTMGDVSVSYNQSLTAAGKFNLLLDKLINGRMGDLLCYRKIRW